MYRSKTRPASLVCFMWGVGCSLVVTAAAQEQTDRDAMRRDKMVRQQIEARGITDPEVLRALRKVPRHEFVPDELHDLAYSDRPLPIGHEQTISQPYIVALMSQALELKKNEKVLEIGTGSGYQAAVLAELTSRVYSIEILEPLAQQAKKKLVELGYPVHVRTGDGYLGWPEEAPFDAIIVTAAPAEVPQPLLNQLAEGGRLVIPVGEHRQVLERYTRRDGKLHKEKLAAVRFVPMTGEAQKESKVSP